MGVAYVFDVDGTLFNPGADSYMKYAAFRIGLSALSPHKRRKLVASHKAVRSAYKILFGVPGTLMSLVPAVFFDNYKPLSDVISTLISGIPDEEVRELMINHSSRVFPAGEHVPAGADVYILSSEPVRIQELISEEAGLKARGFVQAYKMRDKQAFIESLTSKYDTILWFDDEGRDCSIKCYNDIRELERLKV